MKKIYIILFSISLLFLVSNSCARKKGCPVNDPDKIGAKTGKKGKLSTKKGNSNLFPKKMRKNM